METVSVPSSQRKATLLIGQQSVTDRTYSFSPIFWFIFFTIFLQGNFYCKSLSPRDLHFTKIDVFA